MFNLNISSKTKYAPYVGYAGTLIGAVGVWRASFGRNVSRIVNGKEVKYHIQPLSPQEIKERMFTPVGQRTKLNLSSMQNHLKHLPKRAPIACAILAISLILDMSTYFSNQQLNFKSEP